MAGERRIALHHIAQNAADVRRRERFHSDQHLVHDDADREEIASRRDIGALHLLGRHVVRRAEHRSDLRQGGVGGPSDAEVGDFRLTVRGEKNVRRLDVAVNHAFRVRVRQTAKDVFADAQGVIERQRLRSFEPVAQRFALDPLRGEERDHIVLVSRLVQRHDVRMLHRAADFRLALQSLKELRGVAFVFELLLDLNGFQRHTASDPAVARQVDHPHRAAAED